VTHLTCVAELLCTPAEILLVSYCCDLAPVGNKGPGSSSLTPPPLVGWRGESEWKGENLRVGIKTV